MAFLDNAGVTKLVSYLQIKIEDLITSKQTDMVDVFYPVGSYYETSDTSFDPNVSWGGTWVLELEGQVHVSGVPSSSYEVDGANQANGIGVSDGGAGMVTLTANEIPAHTHGSKSLSASFSGRRNGNDYVSHWQGTNTTISQSSSSTTTTSAVGTTNKHTDIVNFNLSHEHTSVGGGQAHENMPPYIVVNRWHRTA